ncbi:hypothetical protein QE152_g38479 [Popillia japonica]|uniref:Uncharacterized protein n=1 Tax=Popillia japonica TaxID=7064 RepID=A0AAW1HWS0_POPJA
MEHVSIAPPPLPPKTRRSPPSEEEEASIKHKTMEHVSIAPPPLPPKTRRSPPSEEEEATVNGSVCVEDRTSNFLEVREGHSTTTAASTEITNSVGNHVVKIRINPNDHRCIY